MADVSEKVADHLVWMRSGEILSRSVQVEKIDAVARRTFGLDSPQEAARQPKPAFPWPCGCAGQLKERVASDEVPG